MAKRHASKDEAELCSVEGCNEPAKKSLSKKKVADVLAGSLADTGRHAHLCKKHYSEYKKATKKDRELERLGR